MSTANTRESFDVLSAYLSIWSAGYIYLVSKVGLSSNGTLFSDDVADVRGFPEEESGKHFT